MNILDYVKNTKQTFSEKELCEGDGFVFAILCHSDLSDCIGQKLKDVLSFAHCGQIADVAMFRLTATSKRFSECVIEEQKTVFLDEERCHFSMTLFSFDGGLFLAARGTDDTTPGWLENIDFVCKEEMRGQRFAKEYLNEIAARHAGPLFLGGHSKGGNLSVYAAAFCRPEVRQRIRAVYDYDGPGFLPTVRAKEGFADVQARVRRFSPRRSFVGMVYRENDPCTVIYSQAFWIPEHFVYNWQIDENGIFVRAKKFKNIAFRAQRTFSDIRGYMTEERCETLATLGTEAFARADIRHGNDFSLSAVAKVLSFAHEQDKESKKMLRKLVGLFIKGFLRPVKSSKYIY